MSSSRRQSCFLIGIFLLMICSGATVQVCKDLWSGHRLRAVEVFTQVPTQENLRTYEGDLEDHSPVAESLRVKAQFIEYFLWNDLGEKALAGRDGWFFYKPGFTYQTQRPATHRKEDPFNAIVSFRNQLASRGISLVVVPVPDKETIYPEMLPGISGHTLPQANPTKQLISRLESAHVDVIDLFDLFSKVRIRSSTSFEKPLYLAQDSHWSPIGLKLAVHFIAEHLQERYGMAPGPITYEEKPLTMMYTGDILQMLRNPLIASAIPPEMVQCSQIIRTGTGEPYHDEIQSPVLVIGDSFLSIFERDEPGSAGFTAHLAMEMHQPVTSIVSDGGGATLVREELYRNPQMLEGKKVIVWEFVERDIGLAMDGWKDIPLPKAK